jgi:hypothetical protein
MERERLARYVRRNPPPPSWLGLALPHILKPIQAIGTGPSCAIRWAWSPSGPEVSCIVAVCEHRPTERDDPESFACLRKETIARDAPTPYRIHPEGHWSGYHVVVWGLVNLGFLKFHTAPLVLGRLDVRRGVLASLLGWFQGGFRSVTGRRRAARLPDRAP